MKGLTKENFFNRMMEQYPITMNRFCGWIDEEKKSIDWANIFKEDLKFHDLPLQLQIGILSKFFVFCDCDGIMLSIEDAWNGLQDDIEKEFDSLEKDARKKRN